MFIVSTGTAHMLVLLTLSVAGQLLMRTGVLLACIEILALVTRGYNWYNIHIDIHVDKSIVPTMLD